MARTCRLGCGLGRIARTAGIILGLVACADPGQTDGAADVGAADLPVFSMDSASGDAFGGPDESTPDVPRAVDAVVDSVTEPDAPAVADVPVDVAAPPDAQTPTVFSGGVLLSEVDSEFLNTAVAGARFTAVPLPPPDQQFGPCGVSFTDPDIEAPPEYGYDAGIIDVNTAPPVTLTPVNEAAAGTGYTSNLPSGTEDFLPEIAALITVSGQGGADIGAFSLVVQAPEPISITSPNVGGLGTSVSKSAPLVVAWPAKNGDQILLSLNPLTSDLIPAPKAGPAMACVVEGDPGSFSIPVEALAAMGSGNHALAVTRLKSKTGSAASGATVGATVTRSNGGIVNLN